jgi:hypothetical protein
VTILFPRVTLQLWSLDENFARFNVVRLFIGRANPVIDGSFIHFPYSYSLGLSIPFSLYARLKGHDVSDTEG